MIDIMECLPSFSPKMIVAFRSIKGHTPQFLMLDVVMMKPMMKLAWTEFRVKKTMIVKRLSVLGTDNVNDDCYSPGLLWNS